MEMIIQRKLQTYNQLKVKLSEFKEHLRAEEEAHNQTVAKGFGNKR